LYFYKKKIYIEILFSQILFKIPLAPQHKTHEQLRIIKDQQARIEDRQKRFDEKLEVITEKLENISAEIATHRKRICVHDTYLRSKPYTKSKKLAAIAEFESVILLDNVVKTHKWIEVKYIDLKDNQVKTGWVPKKYFKEY
jgi:hypothetical protein